MELLDLVQADIILFFLVLMRMSAFFVTWPVFGSVNVPAPVKILISLMVALILFPTIKGTHFLQLNQWQTVMLFAAKEVLVGLVISFICTLFFFVVSIASDLVSITIGIASAKIFNPTLAMSQTPVDQLYYIMAVMIFLFLNFHHVFLTGLVHSYDVVPVAKWSLNFSGFVEVVYFAKELILIGLRLASPVLVSILLINMMLAIVGRTVPQINVLVTSLPLNILAGVVILLFSVPFLLSFMGESLQEVAQVLFGFLKTV